MSRFLLLCLLAGSLRADSRRPYADRQGEPLPAGAVARFNATRLKPDDDSWISQVTFSPDGRFLTSTDKSSIRLWEVSTGRPLYQIGRKESYELALVRFS